MNINKPPQTNREKSSNMSTSTLERLTVEDSQEDASEHGKALEAVQSLQQEKLREQREVLVNSPELRQAIHSVAQVRKEAGDPNLATVNLDELVSYEDFDSARIAMRYAFDFRTKDDGTYGERTDGDARANEYYYPHVNEAVEAEVNAAAEVLRLAGDTEPEQAETDATLILGGAGRSLLDRTTYAKELIDDGKMIPKKIVLLASERAVNEAEQKRGGEYATGATTEFELAIAAVENVFDVKIAKEDITQWIDHGVEHDIPKTHKVIGVKGDVDTGRPDIFIVSSAIVTDPFVDGTKDGHPIKILRNRANTPDTFETFGRLENPEPGSRVTLITRTIFEPFQKAGAMKQLNSRGVICDAASYSATHYGAAPDKTHALAMEMLSAADALAK
jgi:hypothetical protein